MNTFVAGSSGSSSSSSSSSEGHQAVNAEEPGLATVLAKLLCTLLPVLQASNLCSERLHLSN